MYPSISRFAAATVFMAVAAVVAVPVQAQLMDTLKNAAGSQVGGHGSALGGLSLPSVGGASTSNVAGMLQYCVQNKLTNSTSGSSVKNALVNKLGGSSKASHESGFAAGSKGMLESGGKGVDLNGLTGSVKEKVCDQVLQHAKSLI